MDDNLRIVEETDFDFDLTAKLAWLAFGKENEALSPERFRWTYQAGYRRIVVFSAFVGDQKVGQLSAILSDINVEEGTGKAGELVDLFVSPDHRRRSVIGGLYGALRDYFAENGITNVYAYPNGKAAPLNRKYFKMERFAVLPLRIGMRAPFSGIRKPAGVEIYTDFAVFFQAFEPSFSESFVSWDADSFKQRLGSPVHEYICAGDSNFGILCSPRQIRGVRTLLVCGTYCNDSSVFSRRRAARLLSYVCAKASAVFFIYAGWNRKIDFSPGFAAPEWLMGNKFEVQSNFIGAEVEPTRLELIDIDYA